MPRKEYAVKLWLLRPIENLPAASSPWEPWYDKAFGFVVRAETEKEARELANKEGGAETGPITVQVYRTGGDPWLDPKLSTCVRLTAKGSAGVIISDIASA